MVIDTGTAALRRLAFEASLTIDLDVSPTSEGVLVQGTTQVEVTWAHLEAVTADIGTAAGAARWRVGQLLRQVHALAALRLTDRVERLRPVGFPVASSRFPGPDWQQARVFGGTLALGLGVLGLYEDPDHVDAVLGSALDAVGEDPAALWPAAEHYLERMGAVAAERLRGRDVSPNARHAVLRPVGDADVITLLGSGAFRRALAQRDGSGMCAVAVPMRRRGWLDLRALDPAFVPAAYAATEPAEQGFARPVLVTADEVSLGSVPA